MNASAAPSLREKQKQQTRMEIIRVAFDLFGQHGYDKVSVEMICEAAGISRATFFNYFPQKELILAEFAKARFAKLRTILEHFSTVGHQPTLDDIVMLFLRISEENAGLAANSKRLLFETLMGQASQGALIATKHQATDAVGAVISRIPRLSKADPPLVAETLFAVYMATTIEWLIQPEASPAWLMENMQARLRLALEGMK